MKVKLFTHTDLDGVGCAVIAKHIHGENVNVTYVDYHNVNEVIAEFIHSEEVKKYDILMITDISVNKEVAESLDKLHRTQYIAVQLLDHHPKLEWLDEYAWATVRVYTDQTKEHKESGTSMIYQDGLTFALDYDTESHIRLLDDFQEQVRRYDTWEWSTIYNDDLPDEMNILLTAIGREEFVISMLFKAYSKKVYFSGSEVMVISTIKKEREKYCEKKLKQVQLSQVDDFTIAAVYVESYLSNVGNYILENIKEDVDLVAMINMPYNTVSCRANDNKSAEAFARLRGGGGHPNAAGFPIGDKTKGMIFSKILEIKD